MVTVARLALLTPLRRFRFSGTMGRALTGGRGSMADFLPRWTTDRGRRAPIGGSAPKAMRPMIMQM